MPSQGQARPSLEYGHTYSGYHLPCLHTLTMALLAMASLALVPMAMFPRRDHRFEATCAGHRVTLLTTAPLSRRGLCFADLDATLARKRRYVHLISSHMGEGGSFKGRESGRGGREVHGKGGKEGGKASREGSPLEALGFRAACAALSPEARTPTPTPTLPLPRASAQNRIPFTTYHTPLTSICRAPTLLTY